MPQLSFPSSFPPFDKRYHSMPASWIWIEGTFDIRTHMRGKSLRRASLVWFAFVSDPSTMSQRSSVLARHAFLAASLLCGVSFAGDELTKSSTGFFDKFCGECHYEDQSG